MPSDLAKKKAAKKKEAAKARQRPRKGHEENGDAAAEPQVAEERSEGLNGQETAGERRERRGFRGWVLGLGCTPRRSRGPGAGP